MKPYKIYRDITDEGVSWKVFGLGPKRDYGEDLGDFLGDEPEFEHYLDLNDGDFTTCDWRED